MAKRTITDKSIKEKAREVALALNISDEKFRASAGWIENFKHRHGIRKGLFPLPRPSCTSESDRSEDELGHPRKRRRVDVEGADSEGNQLAMPSSSETHNAVEEPRISAQSYPDVNRERSNQEMARYAPPASRPPGDSPPPSAPYYSPSTYMPMPTPTTPYTPNALQNHVNVFGQPVNWTPRSQSQVYQQRVLPPPKTKSPVEAFNTIFDWIKSQPPEFASRQEKEVLVGLSHKASRSAPAEDPDSKT